MRVADINGPSAVVAVPDPEYYPHSGLGRYALQVCAGIGAAAVDRCPGLAVLIGSRC